MILLTKRVRQYIFCLALLCAGVMTASAATLTVTKTDDTNDTVCDADCSLREAIAAASSGDTIVFASPTFDAPQIITLSDAAGFQELFINKNLTITGRGANLLTVRRLSSAANFRIFGITTNRPNVSDGADIGTYELQSPTTASVTISGRVLVSKQRGLTNARVYLTNAAGETRSVQTNSFGYYRFEDVGAGETCVFQVVSKRYQFAPQVVTITEELTDLNFVAAQ